MKLICIVVFGLFNRDDLEYFSSIPESTHFNLRLFSWTSSSKLFKEYCRNDYTLIPDPESLKDVNNRYVNCNRQISHWNTVFGLIKNQYILKIRPDSRIIDHSKLVEFLETAINLHPFKIHASNITTISPRFINLCHLPNHFSDWHIFGDIHVLKNSLRHQHINESSIIRSDFTMNRLSLQAKSKQLEQLIWTKPLRPNNIRLYPNSKFGLDSIKYPNQKIYSWLQPFSLLRPNYIECCLWNLNMLCLIRFYFPLVRIIGFLIFNLWHFYKFKSFFIFRI